ncbi:MAG: enoyl-CoA hydratase/isomerase family protein [Deltaproteobacteria bacterium]|nr:MAG: enoyl-CoA hydratase/isomerase family protein [Deltaproteobacteria bacterium]
MEHDEVLYEVDGEVALVTLNRPRYRNAQSWRLLDALDAAFDRAMEDAAVRAVVVRGAGDHFSSGHDLGTPEQRAEQEARGIPERGLRNYENFRKVNLDYTLKWRSLPKPTIAMVRGYCIFGGWMIAAAMDLVFASPDARFLAGLVEYFSAPFDLHPRKAKELIFESRFIDAEEARALGFVNRVYPADALERETLAYARRVGENGRALVRMAKLAINKAQDIQGFSAAMESAFADFLVLFHTAGDGRGEGERRLGAVDLALRGQRGERFGLAPGGSNPDA